MYYLPFPEEWWSAGAESRPEDPDVSLALAVVDRLRAVRRLRGHRIEVRAQNRVVILEGKVPSDELKALAGEHAWDTAGVFDVCNRLAVPRRRLPAAGNDATI
jgi:osmotically-inducible protein OsmY